MNPFSIYGKPVPANLFWGRQDIVRYIMDRITSGSSTSLIGERRIGKTSLLRYLTSPEAIQDRNFETTRPLFVYVDFIAFDQVSPSSFWTFLLQEMAGVSYDKPWANNIALLLQDLGHSASDYVAFGTLSEFFKRVRGWGYRPIFLLDEFEYATRGPNLNEKFFGQLRVMANNDLLVFITATRDYLNKVCHQELLGSPFWNIFAPKILNPFSEMEFNGWLDHRLGDQRSLFTIDVRDVIIKLSGRHPFFSEMAANHYYYLLEKTTSLTREDHDDVIRHFRDEAQPHFDYYWENSSDGEKIHLALLALADPQKRDVLKAYKHKDLDSLCRRSLVLGENDSYHIMSTVLAAQIKNEVYCHNEFNAETFEQFLDRHKSEQPKEQMKHFGEQAQKLFANMKPKYWAPFLEYFVYKQDTQVLLEKFLQLLKN